MNKLLFYTDFSFYSRAKRGISGAEYLKMERGPAYSGYNDLLNKLEKDGRIKRKPIKSKEKPATIIIPPKGLPTIINLSEVEKRVADWVIDTYGHLTTSQIIKASHLERAWYEPLDNQTLDYNHAFDLNILPPEDVFKIKRSREKKKPVDKSEKKDN